MAKFLKSTVVALGALLLSGSVALAQTPPQPGPDSGKTPASTQTAKKGRKSGKKKGRKKGTRKPKTDQPQSDTK